MAYWVDEQGTIVGGLEAFFSFLDSLATRKIFMFFWRFRLYRHAMIAIYGFVAK